MRQAIQNLEASKIREVANAGIGRSDVLAFWFGESDEVTPDFIRQAAIESLQRGETFYAHNLGLPELREAIAATPASCTAPVGATRIAVTSGGVNALMLAVQALVGRGRRGGGGHAGVAQPDGAAGDPGRARCSACRCVPRDGAWTLDLRRAARRGHAGDASC